jgi:cytochrome c oxidase subunit 2
VRLAPLVAGGLAVAAAAMVVVALTSGEGDTRQAATPRPVADRSGLDVWVEHGCGSCHTLAAANATGTLGPDLGATLEGMPAAYVKESIVAPAAAATAGYDAGMMPEDYGTRIPPDDLDRLVTFLLQSAKP